MPFAQPGLRWVGGSPWEGDDPAPYRQTGWSEEAQWIGAQAIQTEMSCPTNWPECQFTSQSVRYYILFPAKAIGDALGVAPEALQDLRVGADMKSEH